MLESLDRHSRDSTLFQFSTKRLKVRKRVESIFGWMKTVGGFRRSRYVGLERIGLCGELVATAYNLVRMSRLIADRGAEVPVFS